MALGKTRITNRGYKTVYTVPAGKRAVVNAIAYGNAASDLVVSATTAVTPANADFVAPGTGIAATNAEQSFAGTVAGQNFGYAVAVDGNYAVVGTGDSINGANSRVLIYFYNGTTWTLQQTINDPFSSGLSSFGSAVAISGDHIIVGNKANSQDNGNNGRAYRYTRSGTTWSLTATYNNPSTNTNEFFGRSVAIAGDYIVIGSHGFNGVAGRAYGYRVSTGTTLQATFTNPSGGGSELYGFAVACWSDGRVVIGSYGFSLGAGTGRAYYYAAFTNTVTATINSPTGVTNERFGYTVACDQTGNFFAIGAEGFPAATEIGRVYTYSTVGLIGTVGTALATIANPTGTGDQKFGTGLAMDFNGNLLVGAYHYDAAATNRGRAYYFARSANTWTLAQTFENPTPAAGDSYGFGVGLCPAYSAYTYRGVTAYGGIGYVIGAVLDSNNSLGANGIAYFENQQFSAAQKTQVNAQIDNLLTQQDLASKDALDRVTLAVKQTFERTGLVLDEGESLIVSLPDANGDVSVQVRGYEETL